MAFVTSRERRWGRGGSHCCRWEPAQESCGSRGDGWAASMGPENLAFGQGISILGHLFLATCWQSRLFLGAVSPLVSQGFWGRMICPLLSGGSSPCPWVLPGDCLTHCLLILFNHRQHCVMDPRPSPDFRLRNQTLPRDLCKQHFFLKV